MGHRSILHDFLSWCWFATRYALGYVCCWKSYCWNWCGMLPLFFFFGFFWLKLMFLLGTRLMFSPHVSIRGKLYITYYNDVTFLLLLLLLSVIWPIHNHSAPLRNCVVSSSDSTNSPVSSSCPIPPCLPDWRFFFLLDSYYWCFVISCSSKRYSKSTWSFVLESTFISYHHMY